MVFFITVISQPVQFTAPLVRLILETKHEITENLNVEVRQTKAITRRITIKQEKSSTNIKMNDRLKRHVQFAKYG